MNNIKQGHKNRSKRYRNFFKKRKFRLPLDIYKKENTKAYRWGKHSVHPGDLSLLEGPKSKAEDLKRVGQISREFMKGFRAFHQLGPCITFFGSARFRVGHHYYELARATAAAAVQAGFTVMTGGGPGIMEAANRGAKEHGGYSVGCNIRLPAEQQPNGFLDLWTEFDYFFVRKVMLIRYSYAFIVLPGGFGTLDEVFETITLIQTKKLQNFPIVMMGMHYWEPLKSFIDEVLIKKHTISPEDLNLLHFTDSPKEAISEILAYTEKRYGAHTSQKEKNKKAY